jgi:chemotaxis protein CheD
MKQKIDIWIGEYYASDTPTVIGTLLGSCVAVCLFDPIRRVGGMNHILLPDRADVKGFNAPARYGINAMELLINRIMNLNGGSRRFIAKIFGGARLLPSIPDENSPGRQNVDFVETFLKQEQIRVSGMDVGGCLSRKILFHTDTGDVWVKRNKSGSANNKVTRSQDGQVHRIRKQAQSSGEIELFLE